METSNEQYLDRLVIKYIVLNIGLEILQESPEEERPRVFLERVGWNQKKDYIEDTLNSHLSGNLQKLPEGDLYVFTPEDGFKYQKHQNIIRSVGLNINGEDDGVFTATLKEVISLIERQQSTGMPALAPVLFFDKASKETFEKGLQEKHVRFSASTEDLIIQNYGTVKLYKYELSK